jgi:hypothetical protein
MNGQNMTTPSAVSALMRAAVERSIANLLADLRGRGFTLRRKGGELLVSPARRLSAADCVTIRATRDVLLELLASERAEEEKS